MYLERICPYNKQDRKHKINKMETNKKRLHLTKKILQEYSRKTTIHGIQFIGDTYRPYCERLWWLLAFIFSLALCGMFIRNILDKLERTPVMVSFANKPVSVLQVSYMLDN